MNITDAQIEGAARSFAQSGIIRIVDFFEADLADRLYQHFDSEVEWSRVVSQGELAWDLTPEALAAMDEAKERAFLAKVHETARNGFQFLFDSRIVSDDPKERAAKGQLLDRVLDGLNHPDSLDMFRKITSAPDIRVVDGQATRYLPGHFLTCHDDGIDGQDRVAAYVINLTHGWRTDWGGLLQFHNAGGDVPLALKPGFNTIHLFRVPQVHSVSYVTPFAGAPRYAITGWLRR
jgi:SM-20-related protein